MQLRIYQQRIIYYNHENFDNSKEYRTQNLCSRFIYLLFIIYLFIYLFLHTTNEGKRIGRNKVNRRKKKQIAI